MIKEKKLSVSFIIGRMRTLLVAAGRWSLQQMQQCVQSSGCKRSHRKLGMARAGSDMFEQIIALRRN